MKTILLIFTLVLSHGLMLAQNSCEEALEVSQGTHECATLIGEVSDDLECAGLLIGEYVNWYYYTAEEDETLLVTSSLSQNGNWDSRLNILTGPCGTLTCLASDDDGGSGYTSDLTFEAEAGVTYFIVFDDQWTTNPGEFYIGSEDDVTNYVDPGNTGGGGDETPETLIIFEATTLPNVIAGDCVVDMNGDFLDDIVSVSGSTATVSYQQENGTYFSGIITGPSPENSPSWSIAAGDLDNNGMNDLMYGGGGGVSLMLRSDDGSTFTEWATDEYVFSQRGNMVDINNDGILDAYMCHDVAPNVYMLSDGAGGFEYIQGGLGETPNGGNYGSVWIDYNNDGLIDMFIAKCRGGDVPENINQLHRNNGDGTFTEVGEEVGLADNVQTWSSAWADYDNDGDMDVFVGASSTSNGSHKMMRNDDGIFVDITAQSGILASMPTGIEHVCHDYNNDGFVDIDISGTTMLLNNGDMTFTHSNTAVSNGPVGDLNNDGYLDVVSPFGGQVYFNQSEGNNYLKINPIGVESNKNGIGARVTIESSMGTQIRDIKSGDGFGNMSMLTAHFGIGQDEIVESVTINWPSGIVTTLYDVYANNTLNIVEIEGDVVSVQEMLEEKFNVYPNPTSDFLNISSDMNFNSFPIEILDLSGRIVLSTLIKDNRVKLEGISSGTYLARINANGTYHQVQFVKE